MVGCVATKNPVLVGLIPDEARKLVAHPPGELHDSVTAVALKTMSTTVIQGTSKTNVSHLYTQSMPSFSLTMLPSFESTTASVSPSACFFRNFLRPAQSSQGQKSTSCLWSPLSSPTLAQLAVYQGRCRRKRLCCILKFAEALEPDHLQRVAVKRWLCQH